MPACNVHVTELKKGDIVTLSFQFNTRKVTAANITIHRVRTDISWEFIVDNYANSKSQNQYANGMYNRNC